MNRWKYSKDVEEQLPIIVMDDGEGTRTRREIRLIFATDKKTIATTHGGLAATLKDGEIIAPIEKELTFTFEHAIVDFCLVETSIGFRAVVLTNDGSLQILGIPSKTHNQTHIQSLGDIMVMKGVRKHAKSNQALNCLRVAPLALASFASCVPLFCVTYINAPGILTLATFAIDGDVIKPKGIARAPLVPSHLIDSTHYFPDIKFMSPAQADADRVGTWGAAPVSANGPVASPPEVFVLSTYLPAGHADALSPPAADVLAEAVPAADVGKKRRSAAPTEAARGKRVRTVEAPVSDSKSVIAASEAAILASVTANANLPPSVIRALAYSHVASSLVEVRSFPFLSSLPTINNVVQPRLRTIIPGAPSQFVEFAVNSTTKNWAFAVRDCHIGRTMSSSDLWIPYNAPLEDFAILAIDAGAVLSPEVTSRSVGRALLSISAPEISIAGVHFKSTNLSDILTANVATSLTSMNKQKSEETDESVPTLLCKSDIEYLQVSRPAGLLKALESISLTEALWCRFASRLNTEPLFIANEDKDEHQKSLKKSKRNKAEKLLTKLQQPNRVGIPINYAPILANAVERCLLPDSAVRRLALLATLVGPSDESCASCEPVTVAALLSSSQLDAETFTKLMLTYPDMFGTAIKNVRVSRNLLTEALRTHVPFNSAVDWIKQLTEWLSLSIRTSHTILKKFAPSMPPTACIIEFLSTLLDAKFSQISTKPTEDILLTLKNLQYTSGVSARDAKLAAGALSAILATQKAIATNISFNRSSSTGRSDGGVTTPAAAGAEGPPGVGLVGKNLDTEGKLVVVERMTLII